LLCAPLVYAERYLDLSQSTNGQERLRLTTSDFEVKINTNSNNLIIKSILDKTSIEWVRIKNVLLIPKARIKIKVSKTNKKLHLTYKDQIYNFQQSTKSMFAVITISLFEKGKVFINDGKEDIANIQIIPKAKKRKILVDFSCSRNDIKVDGLENELFTIGCHTKPVGKFGKEKPMLEILWMSPELKIKNSSLVPYNAAFLNKLPVKVNVVNIYTGKEKVITISVKIPKRLHRLFTAYGLGPYSFNTKTVDKEDKVLSKSEPLAPALFFYINYKISDTTSIRGFDAAVFKESKFNNAGIYLGNDFGFSFDNKLYFSTLLGVQYLYFKFDEKNPEVSQPIFPQGIEVMYRHAFDIPNYIISGGIFLSPSDNFDYKNVWVRWGKNYFWELNFIEWGQDEFKASMWGLSIGFPFKGFL
jgi:hypothetical protein